MQIQFLTKLFCVGPVSYAEIALYIYLTPRQYINAETSAGGIPHWITTEIAGQPRSNDTDYRAAWQDYIAGIIKETVPNQISFGGPVIGKLGFADFYASSKIFLRFCQRFKLVSCPYVHFSQSSYLILMGYMC